MTEQELNDLEATLLSCEKMIGAVGNTENLNAAVQEMFVLQKLLVAELRQHLPGTSTRYVYQWEAHDNPALHGIFVADEKDVQEVLGKTLWFPLDEYTGVHYTPQATEFTKVTNAPAVVRLFVAQDLESGSSPIAVYEETCREKL
jgi:hypothetical protein